MDEGQPLVMGDAARLGIGFDQVAAIPLEVTSVGAEVAGVMLLGPCL